MCFCFALSLCLALLASSKLLADTRSAVFRLLFVGVRAFVCVYRTISVTCLETKRPSWQKARILHLSSQLEESMFFSGGSMVRFTYALLAAVQVGTRMNVDL